jgi:GST-like protein
MIDLYTWTTPNGRKVSIALEEMGLEYTVHPIPLRENVQKEDWFLAHSPNGRVPALVDDGFSIFESGAILLYLAEKTGMFLGEDLNARSRVTQWLMWQMGGLGPMQGQANVFNRYWPEKIPTVLERYQKETARLYGVMNSQLEKTNFLAGDYSIADMASYPWVAQHDWSGVELTPFPHLQRWYSELGDRPAVARGMNVPERQDKPDMETGQAIVTS